MKEINTIQYFVVHLEFCQYIDRVMIVKELFQIPNMVSMIRVLLVPVIGYYLSLDTNQASLIAMLLIILAGVTDGLDGYLARKLKTVGTLGITLDPIADKIFAGLLVVLLVIFRDFPLWMAFVILGRDLLILLGVVILLEKEKREVQSLMTGKYCFAIIAVLLSSYVIRFEFGIEWFTYLTLIFSVLSIAAYLWRYHRMKNGLPPAAEDTLIKKSMRLGAVTLVSIITIYQLYLQYQSFF